MDPFTISLLFFRLSLRIYAISPIRFSCLFPFHPILFTLRYILAFYYCCCYCCCCWYWCWWWCCCCHYYYCGCYFAVCLYTLWRWKIMRVPLFSLQQSRSGSCMVCLDGLRQSTYYNFLISCHFVFILRLYNSFFFSFLSFFLFLNASHWNSSPFKHLCLHVSLGIGRNIHWAFSMGANTDSTWFDRDHSLCLC